MDERYTLNYHCESKTWDRRAKSRSADKDYSITGNFAFLTAFQSYQDDGRGTDL